MNVSALTFPAATSNWKRVGWVHAFGGAIAALIGPFQLITPLRTSWPRVHVWMGRTYLLAVLAGGLAGFWLYSGAQAYIAIRGGNVQAHRRKTAPVAR